MSPPLKAGQYVRMSTDMQRYSIDHQLAAMGFYAEAHGYQIVRTYADEGRSGLDLAGRPGLQRLLDELPEKKFDVLLVYDVSRWGRFQDVDEGAYYEHLCKRAGVCVIYCGEPFENDDTGLSSVIKALKRVMAAEYSRELSTKVVAGQHRTVQSGFHRGGRPGIGLARALVDDHGVLRRRLARGEEKHLKSDRVKLIPGPPSEIHLVIRIYEMFVRGGLREAMIAERLNNEGLRTPDGAMWRERGIRKILESERNIGTKIHGRMASRLKSPARLNPPEHWLVQQNAFPAIVPLDLYDGAQRIFAARSRRKTDQELLDDLRALWVAHGRLSTGLIRSTPGIASTHTYYHRFGTLTAAYERIGYRSKRPLTLPKRPDLEAMLEHLQGLRRRHGRLSRDLINAQPDGPSARLYEWHFGSLGYAYGLIGYRAKGGRAVEPSGWRREFVEGPRHGDDIPRSPT